jgi:hypothetical protein
VLFGIESALSVVIICLRSNTWVAVARRSGVLTPVKHCWGGQCAVGGAGSLQGAGRGLGGDDRAQRRNVRRQASAGQP